MARILITGGEGFIGSNVANKLVGLGHAVTSYDISRSHFDNSAEFVEGDILDGDRLEKVIVGHDWVVHTAGILGTHETVLQPIETSRTNIVGSLYLLEAARRHGAKIINLSKPNVWLNSYSISKDTVEKYCFMYVSEFNLEIVILKLFNVYGPGQKILGVRKALPTWIASVLQEQPVEIYGSGGATVDWIHVDDVGNAIVKIMESFDGCKIKKSVDSANDIYCNFQAFSSQVLELGSGISTTVIDSVGVLADVSKLPVEIKHVEMRRGEIDNTTLKANISRLKDLTHFESKTELRQGFYTTFEHYKKNLSRYLSGQRVP